MAVFLAIWKNLCVNLALNGCVFDNIGCIYGSNSLYNLIIGRGLYTLININTCIYMYFCRLLNAMYPYNNAIMLWF